MLDFVSDGREWDPGGKRGGMCLCCAIHQNANYYRVFNDFGSVVLVASFCPLIWHWLSAFCNRLITIIGISVVVLFSILSADRRNVHKVEMKNAKIQSEKEIPLTFDQIAISDAN